MAGRKTNRRDSRGRSRKSVTYILEQGSIEELIANKSRMAALLKYYWNYYAELAYQRGQANDQLKQVLNEISVPNFSFKRWQRAVKYRYSLNPLSIVGSVKGIGNRFNMGEDVNPNLPSFAALYLASDKDTALQETLGRGNQNSELSAIDLALTAPDSISIVSMSGRLDHAIDLRKPSSLKKFVDVIKGFRLSESTLRLARKLQVGPPEMVTTPTKLIRSILEINWRALPTLFDVPSNSQIFGHLAYGAKIEGIVYPSVQTKKDCLAIFPNNFETTTSFIELDDDPPTDKVITRVDGTNWRDCSDI